eukprot:TRINITY_DN3802_c0_g1_i2.p1 TRINITY_DN3802_c0_g1~~TRINITY_DN3802_c0_g1_i2.p1  ORF type:complete len:472 (+),score=153.99 TRINITY_DN3802_c0_g1_i2:56-1471(+)
MRRPLCVLASLAAACAAKPNFVWIMLDDLGWGEIGLYPAGSAHGRIATPNMDAFGEGAMRFSDAYAGYTVCAPSRTTLMTGRHSGEFVKYGLLGTEIPLGQKVTTIGGVLQQAGYRTAIVGKTAPLTAPVDQGFDQFPLGQIDQAACHDMYPSTVDSQTAPGGKIDPISLPLNNATVVPSRKACMAHPEAFNYTTDMFYATGEQTLDALAKAGDPFFLYWAFTVPHAGGWFEAEEKGNPVPTDMQYAHKKWPDVEKDHAASVSYVDKHIGAFRAQLKALGIEENTVVFIASDNGAHNEGGHDHTFFNSTGGLKGFKRSLYEGGVRSPSMVSWPGTVKPGWSNFQWTFWDVLPTLAELAEADPATLPSNLDGLSFVEQLKTGSQAPREYTFHTWGAAKGTHGYGVRQGDWKGVVKNCRGPKHTPSSKDVLELYNLAADPFETNDIASKHSQVVKHLKDVVLSKNLTCQCYQC